MCTWSITLSYHLVVNVVEVVVVPSSWYHGRVDRGGVVHRGRIGTGLL